MKIAMIIVRTLMGLLFVMGAVTVLPALLSGGTMPMPPDPPAGLVKYMEGLAATHYFLILLKLTELVCGLAFVSGYYVPLATVIIAPVIINIFFTNLVFAPTMLCRLLLPRRLWPAA